MKVYGFTDESVGVMKIEKEFETQNSFIDGSMWDCWNYRRAYKKFESRQYLLNG